MPRSPLGSGAFQLPPVGDPNRTAMLDRIRQQPQQQRVHSAVTPRATADLHSYLGTPEGQRLADWMIPQMGGDAGQAQSVLNTPVVSAASGSYPRLGDPAGYGTSPMAMPFRSRLGLNNQVSAALTGQPIPQQSSFGLGGPRGNYPVNAPIPQAGVQPLTPDQRMQGLLGTRRFQASPFTGDTPIGGIYTSPKTGNELNVVRLPNGTVRVTGSNKYGGPTLDQLQRQQTASARRQQLQDFRTLQNAKRYGLDPRYSPLVWQAAQRQGIMLPQMATSGLALGRVAQTARDVGGSMSNFGPMYNQQQPLNQRQMELGEYQQQQEAERKRRIPPPNYQLGPQRSYQGMGGLLPR